MMIEDCLWYHLCWNYGCLTPEVLAIYNGAPMAEPMLKEYRVAEFIYARWAMLELW